MTEPYTWGSGPGWCEMFLGAILKEYDMAEKKTFNTKTNEGCLVYGGGSYFYDGNEFPVDEWDLEVTFTKKAKPLAVGDVVRFDSWDRVYSVTILAIDDETYWVRTDSGDYHTLGADDLDRIS